MTTSVIALFGLILIMYLLFIVPTKWLKVERVSHNLGIGKKVLQISDIHIRNLRVSNITIENLIKREKPDYIFFTGDYIDKNEIEYEALESFLQHIGKSLIPMYGVLGNHDRYVVEEELVSLLQKNGVTILRNQNIRLDGFVLVGVDDYCKGKHDVNLSFADIEETESKVVITHDPNILCVMDRNFDYLISGHLHGKQVNVPFLFKIQNMGELPRRGIYKGMHKFINGTVYISKGIGQSTYNFRFLVRSEVTIHNI